jgi:hypothetical protein
MDDVQIVRKRTHIWPIVIALIVLAIVIAFALFALGGGMRSTVGMNGLQPAASVSLASASLTPVSPAPVPR